MILVVSSGWDEHATAVLAELARIGAPTFLLDLSTFPIVARLSIRYEAGAPVRIRWRNGVEQDLGAVRVAWWRRPQPLRVGPEVTRPTHRAFALNESQEAIAGLWHILPCVWVNPPAADDAAARKAYQLAVAREVGLDTPETLLTNDPAAARTFVARFGVGLTVYKAFSATEHEWRETRLLRQEEIDLIGAVVHAPVIFQEYVRARCDVRVTIVGDTIFPAAIYSQETEYAVDFRIDMHAAKVEPFKLPVDVEERLLALMRRLGLVYGALDLRVTPEGRVVFLEVNPAGQWLFIEQRTGQPITAALASRLAGHAGSG